MNIKVKIQSQYILDSPMNGTSFDEVTQYKVDLLQSYISNMYKYGVIPITKSGWTNAELVNGASEDFDIDHFNLVMSLAGSEVYDFSRYVKIAETNINNKVSIDLPNSEYPITYIQNPENTEDLEDLIEVPVRLKTWNEWFLNLSKKGEYGGYTANLIEGFYYYNTNGVYKGLQSMTGTELMIINSSNDAELIKELPEIEIIN